MSAIALAIAAPCCPLRSARTEEKCALETRTEALDALLSKARERNRGYVAPTGPELKRVRAAAKTLTRALAHQQSLEPARTAFAGLHMHLVRTQLGESNAVAILEDNDARSGRGIYVFRCGPSQREWLVQVPHSFFDEGTLPVGIALAARGARALFVNSVHRYPGGTPPRDADSVAEIAVSASPSDLAHQRETVWQVMTRAALETFREGAVFQLHGFADRADSEHPNAAVVVSSSVVRSAEAAAEQLVKRLVPVVQPQEALLYPRDIRILGGTTNAQAQLVAAHPPARFLHVEMARSLRQRLLAEPQLLERFTRAFWSGTPE